MSTSVMFDRVRFTTNSAPGTGAVAGTHSAVASYRTPAGASIPNGTMCTWLGVEGTAWEVWSGAYTVSGTSIGRTTFRASSTGGAISFTTAAIFSLVSSAFDLMEPATDSVKGLVETATLAESVAGTSTNVLTPATKAATVDLLESGSFTAAANTDIFEDSAGLWSQYQYLIFAFAGFSSGSAGSAFGVRVSTDGSTFAVTGYWGVTVVNAGGIAVNTTLLAGGSTQTAAQSSQGEFTITGHQGSTHIKADGFVTYANGTAGTFHSNCYTADNGPLRGLRIYATVGVADAGTYTLHGVR